VDPLAGIPETSWPLLQRAEEADPKYGWQHIVTGLKGWRRALEHGHVWEDADGADWPEQEFREQWAATLRELELPRFAKRYPGIIDLLLHRLLEMVVQLAEASLGAPSESSQARGESTQPSESSTASGESSPLADDRDNTNEGQEQDQQMFAEQASSEGDEEQGTDESLAEQLVNEFREEWGQTVDALKEAEESFGIDGAQAFSSSFTSTGAPWHQSTGWQKASKLREVLKQMPSLRELVRSLGRRTALRGPRHRLPMELEQLGGRPGVARSQLAPMEVAGLVRTGALEAMLPVEAQLLVHGRNRPALRALHHSRRVEEALLGYNRASWLDIPTQELRSEEARPADENGPIILCLDTSGSMTRHQGAPETFAKALAFECLRQAHRRARRCCLFAFSAGEELQQLELDLSADGLQRLLEFLQYAFHGGTSLEEVLRASVERLGSSSHWRNADVLLITDGEVPEPSMEVREALQTAREECGARVYGIVVGSKAGDVMAGICSELYKISSRQEQQTRGYPDDEGEVPLDPSEWRLRCIQGRGVQACWAVASCAAPSQPGLRTTFAGASAAGRHDHRAAGRSVGVKCKLEESVESPFRREAKLEGEERNETAAEHAAREARWKERAEAKEREKIAAQKMRAKNGWRWVGGKWVTTAESRAQDEKIEFLLQEARLREAGLELELNRRARAALLGHKPGDPPVDDPIAAKWAEDNLAHFGNELLSILFSASQEAARLGQVQFSTNAVFLGFLTSSWGQPLRKGLLPSGFKDADPLEAAKGAVEAVVQDETPENPSRRREHDLPLTRTMRQMLEAVEAERARFGHGEATAGHLLLTLTSDTFANEAFSALQALGVDPRQSRLVALESLGDFLASAQCSAEAWVLKRCRQIAASAPTFGECVAGLGESHAILTDGLMERSVEAKLLLLAALSGEHLFLLGSPGTAKSLVARRLSKVCAGSFFERLLTRFSVPEEIFGPLSLQALEQDELRRKTRGYLPESDVAFIDEIFKANSSILNTLLMILNDRVFDNGDVRMNVPLWCAVAASNELPDTDELDALYDRFLLRRCVRRISPAGVTEFMRMVLDAGDAPPKGDVGDGSGVVAHSLLSAATSIDLQARARDVEFPGELLEIIAELREYLADEAEPPYMVSDRRLGKAVCLIRIAAAAVGAPKVVEADLLLLRHVFWDRSPAQGDLVVEWLVERFKRDGFGHKASSFLLEGLRKRLRYELHGHTLDAVRRDLSSLHEAAASSLDVALQVAQDAPQEHDEGQQGPVDRFFWLSGEEREAIASVGKQASQSALALGQLLVEASMLAKVIELEDAVQRRELLDQVLGGPEPEEKEPERDEWGDLL